MYNVALFLNVKAPLKSYFMVFDRRGKLVGWFKLLADMVKQKFLEFGGAGKIRFWVRGKVFSGIDTMAYVDDEHDCYLFENLSLKHVKEMRGQVLDCCCALVCTLNREIESLWKEHDANPAPESTITEKHWFSYAWLGRL